MPNQEERAAAFRYYVERVAAHPLGVGCHYFQCYDQFVLGRFDGENYNIGLFDICLRPYGEMLQASGPALKAPGPSMQERPRPPSAAADHPHDCLLSTPAHCRPWEQSPMGGVRFLKKWQPPLFPCPERGRGPCDPAQSLFTDSVPSAAIPPAAGGFFLPWAHRRGRAGRPPTRHCPGLLKNSSLVVNFYGLRRRRGA